MLVNATPKHSIVVNIYYLILLIRNEEVAQLANLLSMIHEAVVKVPGKGVPERKLGGRVST